MFISSFLKKVLRKKYLIQLLYTTIVITTLNYASEYTYCFPIVVEEIENQTINTPVFIELNSGNFDFSIPKEEIFLTDENGIAVPFVIQIWDSVNEIATLFLSTGTITGRGKKVLYLFAGGKAGGNPVSRSTLFSGTLNMQTISPAVTNYFGTLLAPGSSLVVYNTPGQAQLTANFHTDQNVLLMADIFGEGSIGLKKVSDIWYYPLDEKEGGPTWEGFGKGTATNRNTTTRVGGVLGNALDFKDDGNGKSRVTIFFNSAIPVSGGIVSGAAWISPHSSPQGKQILFYLDGGKLCIGPHVFYNNTDYKKQELTLPLQYNKFQHFAFIYNYNTMFLSLYLNGVLVKKLDVSATAAGRSVTGLRSIGYLYEAENFTGIVDEVYFASRAFSDGEIFSFYKAGKNKNGNIDYCTLKATTSSMVTNAMITSGYQVITNQNTVTKLQPPVLTPLAFLPSEKKVVYQVLFKSWASSAECYTNGVLFQSLPLSPYYSNYQLALTQAIVPGSNFINVKAYSNAESKFSLTNIYFYNDSPIAKYDFGQLSGNTVSNVSPFGSPGETISGNSYFWNAGTLNITNHDTKWSPKETTICSNGRTNSITMRVYFPTPKTAKRQVIFELKGKYGTLPGFNMRYYTNVNQIRLFTALGVSGPNICTNVTKDAWHTITFDFSVSTAGLNYSSHLNGKKNSSGTWALGPTNAFSIRRIFSLDSSITNAMYSLDYLVISSNKRMDGVIDTLSPTVSHTWGNSLISSNTIQITNYIVSKATTSSADLWFRTPSAGILDSLKSYPYSYNTEMGGNPTYVTSSEKISISDIVNPDNKITILPGTFREPVPVTFYSVPKTYYNSIDAPEGVSFYRKLFLNAGEGRLYSPVLFELDKENLSSGSIYYLDPKQNSPQWTWVGSELTETHITFQTLSSGIFAISSEEKKGFDAQTLIIPDRIFNPNLSSLSFEISIPESAESVRLSICDLSGKLITSVFSSGEPISGNLSIRWNGEGPFGLISTGVYAAVLEIDNSKTVKTFVLQR